MIHNTHIHPSELLKEMPFNYLRNIKITFINMPLRETALPNVPPEGPAILANIVRHYGGEPYIIDLNGYRIKDEIYRQSWCKNCVPKTVIINLENLGPGQHCLCLECLDDPETPTSYKKKI